MTRAQINVVRAAKDFHSRFSTKTKEEMASMERVVNGKKQKLSTNQLEVQIKGWIPNPSYSRTHDRKICRFIDRGGGLYNGLGW